jgi:type III restriction enzyme
MAKKTQSQSIIRYQASLPNLNRQPWTPPTEHIQKTANSYQIVQGRRPCIQPLKYIETLRKEVEIWRNANYPNVSSTTQDLLNFWFNTNHIINNENFHFRFAQREAIETLIYLYEYKNLRDSLTFFNQYPKVKNPKTIDPKTKEERAPFFDPDLEALIKDASQNKLPRYCAKAATGSGKTFLMAFVAVWSYFHKKREKDSPLSRNILLIAPNVIVYARLKKDFASGKIFKDFPFIPDSWKGDWLISFQMRDQTHQPMGDGAIFLSNIHQLYASRLEEDVLTIPENTPYSRETGIIATEKLSGKKVKKNNELSHWQPSILDQIIDLEELLVINDEAHHVHEKESKWYQSIIEFQTRLKEKSKSISLVYDLSATPKNQSGHYFPWIISDYPLVQAIEDRIVKIPLLVQPTNRAQLEDPTSANAKANAFDEYSPWIRLAMDRYDHHERDFQQIDLPNKPKPVLFIMCNDITQATNIHTGILQHYAKNFKADEILLVHSDRNGDISEKDEGELREIAQTIDQPNSKIKIIISVMMLKEGWDVKNVTIILGLRAYTAKSNILPEQTVGRGLRLMDVNLVGSRYDQAVELIGTKNFEAFIKEIDDYDVIIDETGSTSSRESISIKPDPTKSQFDIEIPYVQSSLIYHHHISKFNVLTDIQISHSLNHTGILSGLNQTSIVPTILIKIIDLVTGKIIHTYTCDTFRSLSEILNEIVHLLFSRVTLNKPQSSITPADLLRITQDFLQKVYFSKTVTFDELDQISMRAYLDTPQVKENIIQTLATSIGNFIQQYKPQVKENVSSLKLSQINAFLWSKPCVANQNKCIFNHTPVWNNLERAFALFLENAGDVIRFSALAETRTIFNIPYFNRYGRPALYYPDFVVVQKVGNKEKHWIIETKGREDDNVALKDAATKNWCQKVTTSTQSTSNLQIWDYMKIPDAFLRTNYPMYFPNEATHDQLPNEPIPSIKIQKAPTLESLIKKLKDYQS